MTSGGSSISGNSSPSGNSPPNGSSPRSGSSPPSGSSSTSPMRFLRGTLRANAAFSTLSGLTFVIGGQSPRTVLIRAIGPTLGGFQVGGALADPTLELLSGQTVLEQNDDWGASNDSSAISGTGFAPPDPQESAILTTLAPGAYTAVVQGVGGATGVGLVEVYDIPPSPLGRGDRRAAPVPRNGPSRARR